MQYLPRDCLPKQTLSTLQRHFYLCISGNKQISTLTRWPCKLMLRNEKRDTSYFSLDVAGLVVPTAFQYLKQSSAKNKIPIDYRHESGALNRSEYFQTFRQTDFNLARRRLLDVKSIRCCFSCWLTRGGVTRRGPFYKSVSEMNWPGL